MVDHEKATLKENPMCLQGIENWNLQCKLVLNSTQIKFLPSVSTTEHSRAQIVMVLDLFFHLNRHKYKILSRWQLNLHQSSYPKSGWKVLCMPLPHVGGCRAQELHGTGGWLGDGRGQWLRDGRGQWWVGDKGQVMGDKGLGWVGGMGLG